MILIGPFTLFFLLLLFCKPVRKALGFLMLLLVIVFFWHSALAQGRCDAPPYGDTPEGWSMSQVGLKNIQHALAEHHAHENMTAVIRQACEAKFGGDRSRFYEVGMTDHDFAIRPPAVLAIQYLGTKMALEDEQQDKRRDTNIYALFLCGTWGSCDMQGQARMTFMGLAPATIYRTIEDCEAVAQRSMPLGSHPIDGRYKVSPYSWYECRGKHVDTWETQ